MKISNVYTYTRSLLLVFSVWLSGCTAYIQPDKKEDTSQPIRASVASPSQCAVRSDSLKLVHISSTTDSTGDAIDGEGGTCGGGNDGGGSGGGGSDGAVGRN